MAFPRPVPRESFEEMIAGLIRESGATEKEIRAAERQALEDFNGAGLLPKGRHRAAEAPRRAR